MRGSHDVPVFWLLISSPAFSDCRHVFYISFSNLASSEQVRNFIVSFVGPEQQHQRFHELVFQIVSSMNSGGTLANNGHIQGLDDRFDIIQNMCTEASFLATLKQFRNQSSALVAATSKAEAKALLTKVQAQLRRCIQSDVEDATLFATIDCESLKQVGQLAGADKASYEQTSDHAVAFLRLSQSSLALVGVMPNIGKTTHPKLLTVFKNFATMQRNLGYIEKAGGDETYCTELFAFDEGSRTIASAILIDCTNRAKEWVLILVVFNRPLIFIATQLAPDYL